MNGLVPDDRHRVSDGVFQHLEPHVAGGTHLGADAAHAVGDRLAAIRRRRTLTTDQDAASAGRATGALDELVAFTDAER
jgi:hypothetical protein